MQLLAEHKTLGTFDLKMNNLLIRDVSSHNFEMKEKSSNLSIRLMNPVASGDNVATSLNSAHKIKEELPTLVPCCEGRELKISKDLVCSGLSAISVKHDGVIQCHSMSCACENTHVPPGLVKHRNSFRSLHRPDLKRVPYLRRMTPEELESLFRGYADLPSNINVAKAIQDHSNNVASALNKSSSIRDTKTDKIIPKRDDGNTSVLRPIPETRSGAEDVPAGMRLHGARARLYTSVLAGAKTGDQVDNASTNEEYDVIIPDVIVPEDEVQLNEELQIILPPRCDDVTTESSTINSDSVAC